MQESVCDKKAKMEILANGDVSETLGIRTCEMTRLKLGKKIV